MPRYALAQQFVGGGGRCGQPESEQVSATVGLGVVGVLLAGMQHGGVVEDLYVAGIEGHPDLEFRVVGDVFEECEGGALLLGQARGVRVALGIADVPGDEEDPRGGVDIDDRWQFEVGRLAGGLFVVAVSGHRVVHDIDEVRCPAQSFVVDGVRADNFGFAAAARGV